MVGLNLYSVTAFCYEHIIMLYSGPSRTESRLASQLLMCGRGRVLSGAGAIQVASTKDGRYDGIAAVAVSGMEQVAIVVCSCHPNDRRGFSKQTNRNLYLVRDLMHGKCIGFLLERHWPRFHETWLPGVNLFNSNPDFYPPYPRSLFLKSPLSYSHTVLILFDLSLCLSGPMTYMH